MFGQDVCFDFQNYHLYIPYAFLHGRLNWDIIPAGALHTFFNPLLDVPSYLLFTSLSSWPRGVKEWLFLPFLRWNFPVLEYRLDIRLILGLISFWALAGWRIFAKKAVFSLQEAMAICLFAGTYGAWVLLFGNMRYAVCLEACSAWLFALALKRFMPLRAAAVVLIVVWSGLMLIPPATWHRHPFVEKTMVFSADIPVPDDAFVLMAGHLSFLVPFLNPRARYAGGVWFDPQDYDASQEIFLHRLNSFPPGYYSHRRDEAVRAAVRAHNGPVYALLPKDDLAVQPAVWARYGVKLADTASSCQPLYPADRVTEKEFLLCRAEKLHEEK